MLTPFILFLLFDSHLERSPLKTWAARTCPRQRLVIHCPLLEPSETGDRWFTCRLRPLYTMPAMAIAHISFPDSRQDMGELQMITSKV